MRQCKIVKLHMSYLCKSAIMLIVFTLVLYLIDDHRIYILLDLNLYTNLT
jgi:hypothetical protein